MQSFSSQNQATKQLSNRLLHFQFISPYLVSGKVHIQRFFQVKIITGTQSKILHAGLLVASKLYIALNPMEQLHWTNYH